MIKLKPCPFCGGEARIKRRYASSYYCMVGCDNPSCVIRPCSDGVFVSKEKAIEAWNTRADDAYSDDGK